MSEDILYRWDNREDARHLIGKNVVIFDSYKYAILNQNGRIEKLVKITDAANCFIIQKIPFGNFPEYIREYKPKKKALIFDYTNTKEAEKYLGVVGYFTDSIKLISEIKEGIVHSNNISNILVTDIAGSNIKYRTSNEDVLVKILGDGYFPYLKGVGFSQFFIVFVDEEDSKE